MLVPVFHLVTCRLAHSSSLHGIHLRALEKQKSRWKPTNHVYYSRFVALPPLVILSYHIEYPGGKDLEEMELDHLDGHKGSKPVRIGNGAADHIQLVCFFSSIPDFWLNGTIGYIWGIVSSVQKIAFPGNLFHAEWIVYTLDRR